MKDHLTNFCSSFAVQLFIVSVLFMAIFQLAARLISYTFMFHQGVLLLSTGLIGGGIGIVWIATLRPATQERVARYLPLLLPWLFFVYVGAVLFTQSLMVHFVVLSLLFGVLFVMITRFIALRSDAFMAVELAGSFVGAAVIVWLSSVILEEGLLITLIIATTLFALLSKRVRGYWLFYAPVLLLSAACLVYVFSTQSLLELVRCTAPADTYKTICYSEPGLGEAVASYPSIKGRSDVFLANQTFPGRLSVYNNGLHAGTTLHEDYFRSLEYSFYEVEIPALHYSADSRVIALGASTGANILTLQKYIPQADITAVELDRTIEQLYQEERYLPYLPKRDSFRFVYQDARTIFETNSEQYDVISMMVESVNTTIPGYVDESTSLVYTAEALGTYIDSLRPGGYLLMQQHHLSAANGAAGDAMIHKLLVTLEETLGSSGLADSLLLYSYRFYNNPNSLQYLAAVYKPDGFTEADMEIFSSWYAAHQRYVPTSGVSTGEIQILHTPDGVNTYTSFFDPAKRAALANTFSINSNTDDRPFRHLITRLPFPVHYYLLVGAAIAILALLIPRVRTITELPTMRLVLVSFFMGLVTFGFQYVLYYKTAAFLDTNLIFFAVFLLIPLLFGAAGGAVSLRISTSMRAITLLVSTIVAGVLITQPLFSLAPVLVFGMIAWLFIFSGMLFPLLLARTESVQLRSVLYGCNICGGGVATISMITAHATIGWIAMFTLVMISSVVLFVSLSRG